MREMVSYHIIRLTNRINRGPSRPKVVRYPLSEYRTDTVQLGYSLYGLIKVPQLLHRMYKGSPSHETVRIIVNEVPY